MCSSAWTAVVLFVGKIESSPGGVPAEDTFGMEVREYHAAPLTTADITKEAFAGASVGEVADD